MAAHETKIEINTPENTNLSTAGLLPRPGETYEEARARVTNVKNAKRLSSAINSWEQSQALIQQRPIGKDFLQGLPERITSKAKTALALGAIAVVTAGSVEFAEHVLHNGVASNQRNTPTLTQSK